MGGSLSSDVRPSSSISCRIHRVSRNLANVRSHEYTIGPDRFFMMGDNSPCSKDSRGWGPDDSAWDISDRKPWEVPRQLLTGKAFYVYWPHGYPIWPNIGLITIIRICHSVLISNE